MSSYRRRPGGGTAGPFAQIVTGTEYDFQLRRGKLERALCLRLAKLALFSSPFAQRGGALSPSRQIRRHRRVSMYWTL